MTDERYPHLSDKLLEAVDWFTDQMKRKLEENSHKGDSWQDDDADQFAYRVREEVIELSNAVYLADKNEGHLYNQRIAIEEAADVANMAMFTAAKICERLL